PSAVKEVFCTCAVEGAGPVLAINKPHIIALSVPHGGRAIYIIIHAYKMALPFDFSDEVISLVGYICILGTKVSPFVFSACFRLGELTIPPRMESANLLTYRCVFLVINIEIEGAYGLIGLVLYGDFCTVSIRHGE